MNGDETGNELHGEAAVTFAETRLRKVGSDPSAWKVFYVDDLTGEHWVMDYPESGQHGGGSPRLVKQPRKPQP